MTSVWHDKVKWRWPADLEVTPQVLGIAVLGGEEGK